VNTSRVIRPAISHQLELLFLILGLFVVFFTGRELAVFYFYWALLANFYLFFTGRHFTTFSFRPDQANYINALAVSVPPFFEPAKPITLGGFFVTLGGFFMTLGEPFFFFFSFIFNVMIGGEYF
jgi:hypothetical protein